MVSAAGGPGALSAITSTEQSRKQPSKQVCCTDIPLMMMMPLMSLMPLMMTVLARQVTGSYYQIG